MERGYTFLRFLTLPLLPEWINEWMSDKGGCRTAPATLGLLKMRKTIKKQCLYFRKKKKKNPNTFIVLKVHNLFESIFSTPNLTMQQIFFFSWGTLWDIYHQSSGGWDCLGRWQEIGNFLWMYLHYKATPAQILQFIFLSHNAQPSKIGEQGDIQHFIPGTVFLALSWTIKFIC